MDGSPGRWVGANDSRASRVNQLLYSRSDYIDFMERAIQGRVSATAAVHRNPETV